MIVSSNVGLSILLLETSALRHTDAEEDRLAHIPCCGSKYLLFCSEPLWP